MGQPVSFTASSSVAPTGTIASYTWNFGDGHSLTTTSPAITHTYSSAGTFTVNLTVTDSAGTSTTQVFTGQTVSRQGGPTAEAAGQVTVATATPPVSPTPPTTPTPPSLIGQGYWLAGADGGVFAFGNAGFDGSIPSIHQPLVAPIVGITDVDLVVN